jgi:hypothetical protein
MGVIDQIVCSIGLLTFRPWAGRVIRLNPFHDLIVYIREVPGMHNSRAVMLEQTEEHVEVHCHPGIAKCSVS